MAQLSWSNKGTCVPRIRLSARSILWLLVGLLIAREVYLRTRGTKDVVADTAWVRTDAHKKLLRNVAQQIEQTRRGVGQGVKVAKKVPLTRSAESPANRFPDFVFAQEPWTADNLCLKYPRCTNCDVTVIVRARDPQRVAKLLLSFGSQTAKITHVFVSTFGISEISTKEQVEQAVEAAAEKNSAISLFHSTAALNGDASDILGLQVQTPYVAFMDDSVIPGPNYLDALARALTACELRCVVGSAAAHVQCDDLKNRESRFCRSPGDTVTGAKVGMLHGVYMVDAKAVKLAFRLPKLSLSESVPGVEKVSLAAHTLANLPSAVVVDNHATDLGAPRELLPSPSLRYLESLAARGFSPLGERRGHRQATHVFFVDSAPQAIKIKDEFLRVPANDRLLLASGRDGFSTCNAAVLLGLEQSEWAYIYDLHLIECFSRAIRYVDIVSEVMSGVQRVLRAVGATHLHVVVDGSPASYGAALGASITGVSVDGIGIGVECMSALCSLSWLAKQDGGMSAGGRAIAVPISNAQTEDRVLCTKLYNNFLDSVPAKTKFVEGSWALQAPSIQRPYISPERSVTVIMTVFRRPGEFKRVLALHLNQTAYVKEVWVNALGGPYVDQFKQLAAEAARLDPRVKYFGSKQNLGYFGRLQLGLLATTDYVVFMDDDITPGPRYYELLVHSMGTERYQGVLGCRGAQYSGCDAKEGTVCNQRYKSHQPGIEVDVLFSTQFIETAAAPLLFREEPVTFLTAEDMHISYSMRKYASMRSVKFYSSTDDSLRGWNDPEIMEKDRSWLDSNENVWVDPKSAIEDDPKKRNHNVLRDHVWMELYTRGHRITQAQAWSTNCANLYFVDTMEHARLLAAEINTPTWKGMCHAVAISGLAPNSREVIFPALGIDDLQRRREQWANVFDLSVGVHYPRQPHPVDIVAETMLSIQPVLEAMLPAKVTVVMDGSASALGAAISAALLGIPVVVVEVPGHNYANDVMSSLIKTVSHVSVFGTRQVLEY